MTNATLSGAGLLDMVESQQTRLLGRHRSRNGDGPLRASGAADATGAFARALSGQAATLDRSRRAGEAAENPADAADGAGTVAAGGSGVVDPETRSRNMREAAEAFSGFFIGTMFKEMRKTVEQNPFGHGDSAERTFQELADEAYADEAAKSRVNAITDLVYQGLMRGASIPKMS